jgi:hypothetical protein
VEKVLEFILRHPKAKKVLNNENKRDNNFHPVYNQRNVPGEVIGF